MKKILILGIVLLLLPVASALKINENGDNFCVVPGLKLIDMWGVEKVKFKLQVNDNNGRFDLRYTTLWGTTWFYGKIREVTVLEDGWYGLFADSYFVSRSEGYNKKHRGQLPPLTIIYKEGECTYMAFHY